MRKKCVPVTKWSDGRITQVKCHDGRVYAVDSHERFW